MHIDAAYAGSAFICPEFRPLLNGVEVRVSSYSCVSYLKSSFTGSFIMWLKDETPSCPPVCQPAWAKLAVKYRQKTSMKETLPAY